MMPGGETGQRGSRVSRTRGDRKGGGRSAWRRSILSAALGGRKALRGGELPWARL